MSKLTKWISDRWGNGPSMSGLKSSIKGTGNFAADAGRVAAPFVSIANPLLGAGIMAASDGIKGKSVSQMLRDAAITGGTGYVLGHAGDIAGKAKGFFGDASPASEVAGSVGQAAGELDPLASLPVRVTPGVDSSLAAVRAAPAALPGASSAAATIAKTAAPSVARRVGGFAANHAGDIVSGAGQVGAAMLGANASNAQTALERRRLEDEEAQVRRQQQREDAQDAALNPARVALLQAMMRRLGLPYAPTAAG